MYGERFLWSVGRFGRRALATTVPSGAPLRTKRAFRESPAPEAGAAPQEPQVYRTLFVWAE